MPTRDDIGCAPTVGYADCSGGLTSSGGVLTTSYPDITTNCVTYWPTTVYASEARVAQLEGEVKVLREMVAALIAGRPSATPQRRKRDARS